MVNEVIAYRSGILKQRFVDIWFGLNVKFCFVNGISTEINNNLNRKIVGIKLLKLFFVRIQCYLAITDTSVIFFEYILGISMLKINLQIKEDERRLK